jgi:hypothetical protein
VKKFDKGKCHEEPSRHDVDGVLRGSVSDGEKTFLAEFHCDDQYLFIALVALKEEERYYAR